MTHAWRVFGFGMGRAYSLHYVRLVTEAEAFTANISIIALVLSVLGFAVAAYSLGWQIYKHFKWARPHLVVTGTWSRMHQSDNPTAFWELEVTVANVGDLETQIENVYWEFGAKRADQLEYRVRGSTVDGRGGLEFDGKYTTYDGEVDPALPVTILPFSSRHWTFRRPDLGPGHGEDLRKVEQGRAAVRWVSRSRLKSELGRVSYICGLVG